MYVVLECLLYLMYIYNKKSSIQTHTVESIIDVDLSQHYNIDFSV